MFRFIAKIRKRRREKKERKNYTRYLRCPACKKKFWGQLPSSKGIQAFQCRCPRCHELVTKENITPTRRRVVLNWGKAIAKAAWHCLAYPVKPLSATKKIVKLEAVMIDEVARVEKKMDAQGEIVEKRLDIQDNALAGIGGMIAHMAGEGSELLFETFESKRLTASKGSIEYQRTTLPCQSAGGKTFIDTLKINDDNSPLYFFVSRAGKNRAQAEFYGDQALVQERHIAQIFGLSFRVIGKFLRKDVVGFFENSYIEFVVQGRIIIHIPLSQLLSKNKIIPFTFIQPLLVPGGRSLDTRLEVSGAHCEGEPFSLQIMLHGEELILENKW